MKHTYTTQTEVDLTYIPSRILLSELKARFNSDICLTDSMWISGDYKILKEERHSTLVVRELTDREIDVLQALNLLEDSF